MGLGQGKRGWEAGERIGDRGKKKWNDVKVKLLNNLIIIITDSSFFYLFLFIEKLDPIYVRYHFDVNFHCFGDISLSPSLRVFVSLSVSLCWYVKMMRSSLYT